MVYSSISEKSFPTGLDEKQHWSPPWSLPHWPGSLNTRSNKSQSKERQMEANKRTKGRPFLFTNGMGKLLKERLVKKTKNTESRVAIGFFQRLSYRAQGQDQSMFSSYGPNQRPFWGMQKQGVPFSSAQPQCLVLMLWQLSLSDLICRKHDSFVNEG